MMQSRSILAANVHDVAFTTTNTPLHAHALVLRGHWPRHRLSRVLLCRENCGKTEKYNKNVWRCSEHCRPRPGPSHSKSRLTGVRHLTGMVLHVHTDHHDFTLHVVNGYSPCYWLVMHIFDYTMFECLLLENGSARRLPIPAMSPSATVCSSRIFSPELLAVHS